MTRSLQLGGADNAHVPLSAATSPWKLSVRVGRPVAASFSAGDARCSDHQQHMVAFERQLDALVGGAEATSPALQHQQQRQQLTHSHDVNYLNHQQQLSSSDLERVVRGTLVRTVSTSSSVGGSSVSGQSVTSETRANTRLNASNKITGRRHRTPRRFEVTDIPNFDEIRKTEVKGRFTIMDLSPDSPMSSPRAAHLPTPPDLIPKLPSRSGMSPRRRVMRKSPSQNSVRSEAPTTLSTGSQQSVFMDPVDSALKTRRVDLNVFDQHLSYLQKESAGMKSLLEGMVSTNSRWMSALRQAGVSFSMDSASVGVAPAGPPAVLPVTSAPSPARDNSTEEKFAAMQAAYLELQKQHDALASKNAQLEAQNLKLATLLEQQTQITDGLRVQLQGVSKYGDNNVSDSDPSSECAADMLFASSSSSTSSSLLECPHSSDHTFYM
ncbi:hypothetical protein PybrP1_002290 [[Pythium] brassicae (nom. inval.)]|nr:hypothetical protein PybrP1_002290 [[Pythium] brassicae (nom. inval.)]